MCDLVLNRNLNSSETMAAKQDGSIDNGSHNLPFTESAVQCPTYTITFAQLQDLVRTQTSLAARLKYALEKQKDNVERGEYEDVKHNLEEETRQHMQTKSKLKNREKELEFALAEVALLTKELANEKEKFKRIYNKLKKSEEIRTSENNALLEKCTEITQVCGVQDDILTVKDKKIRDLKEKLAEQSKHRRLAENESELRLQQERYLIGHHYANQNKSERNRVGNRIRSKLR